MHDAHSATARRTADLRLQLDRARLRASVPLRHPLSSPHPTRRRTHRTTPYLTQKRIRAASRQAAHGLYAHSRLTVRGFVQSAARAGSDAQTRGASAGHAGPYGWIFRAVSSSHVSWSRETPPADDGE